MVFGSPTRTCSLLCTTGTLLAARSACAAARLWRCALGAAPLLLDGSSSTRTQVLLLTERVCVRMRSCIYIYIYIFIYIYIYKNNKYTYIYKYNKKIL